MDQFENLKFPSSPASLVGVGTEHQKTMSRQPNTRGLRDVIGNGVEWFFTNLELADRARLKRLYFSTLEKFRVAQKDSLPDPCQSLEVLKLLGQLTGDILEDIAAQSPRTPEERLRKSILKAMGKGSESSILLTLAMKEALSKLQGSHALDCHCLVSKQVFGQTYEEITAFTGLTIQQVRYRIDKAKLLLKSLLEGKHHG